MIPDERNRLSMVRMSERMTRIVLKGCSSYRPWKHFSVSGELSGKQPVALRPRGIVLIFVTSERPGLITTTGIGRICGGESRVKSTSLF